MDLGLAFREAPRESGAGNANALHARGRRLSVRAVKGAGVWRSSERSGDPCTGEADGSGAGFSQEGQCAELCLGVLDEISENEVVCNRYRLTHSKQ